MTSDGPKNAYTIIPDRWVGKSSQYREEKFINTSCWAARVGGLFFLLGSQ